MMLILKLLSVFIGPLFIIVTNQQLVASKVFDCKLFCGDGFAIDTKTCSCVDTRLNDSKRSVRSSDSVLISKLIRDVDATPVSNARCRNHEQWNGSTCIPLISLCPGGYQWNGNTCIIQSSIKIAALVPSAPDTKCMHAKKNNENYSKIKLPSTVVPTYSTSPMCPFGFIWSENKCIRNPPVCPSEYIYRGNVCHLVASSWDERPQTTTESVLLPTIDDILERNTENENKWQQKPYHSDGNVEQFMVNFDHNTEISAIRMSENKMSVQNQSGENCCSIRSPRICRRMTNARGQQWQCYHHTYRRCDVFCIKPNIYLRPKKYLFVEPLLIMPPPPRRLQKLMQNHAYRETNIDCSGCINGTYGCSSECFAYDCNASDCDFIDEDLLCGNTSSTDDDNSDVNNDDDYEINLYSDICSYSTS